MPIEIGLDEFRAAFVAEADEYLATTRKKLVVIESATREGRGSHRDVRDVFRALHTLKGLAGMVGVEPVVDVTHHMEEVLRLADRRGGTLGAEAIAALVESADWLERAVRAIEKGSAVAAAPARLIAELAHVPGGTGAPKLGALPDADLEAKLAPFEKEQLARGVQGGRRAIRAEFVPSATKAAAGLTINSVREKAARIAEVVRVLPISLPATAEAPGGLAFVLVLLASMSDEEIARTLECDSARSLFGPSPTPVAEPTAEALPGLFDDDDGARPRTLLRVDAGRIDDAIDGLAALIVTRSRLVRATATLADRGVDVRELLGVVADHTRQLRDLRTALLHVRTTPVQELFEKLPLIARAHTRGGLKAVRLTVEAGDAELDKAVAERVFPALVHIVRNAIDHGIEKADERAAAGKPREGQVRIRTASHSNRLLDIVVDDDGRGIDRARVAALAGLSFVPDDRQLLDLICRPGLSTRDEVTSTSGRGMGMDIVRRIVDDQLGGELSLSTLPGRGTTFTLRVPLTIAIVEAFTVRCAGQRFVVPVNAVEAIIEVRRDRRVSGPIVGGERIHLVEFRGTPIPLVSLARSLRMADAAGEIEQALVVQREGAIVAFALERVVGRQEAVVRPLSDPLVKVDGVSGSSDLGDGRATLVLDLLRLTRGMVGRTDEAA